MEYKFKSVHTLKDLALSSLLLLIGVGFFLLNKGIGVFIAICGILTFFVLKAGYRTDTYDIVFSKRSLYVCRACRQSILDFISGKDICPDIVEGNQEGSMFLKVYYNKDKTGREEI